MKVRESFDVGKKIIYLPEGKRFIRGFSNILLNISFNLFKYNFPNYTLNID